MQSSTVDRSTPLVSDSMLTAVAVALFGLCTLAMTCGCEARRASLSPLGPGVGAAAKPAGDVEVLLDREPDRPFVVVGQLEARSLESPMSIEKMRDEAARAGLDGIYWIECATPRSGRCTAKGYVYTKPSDPTKDTTVAAK